MRLERLDGNLPREIASWPEKGPDFRSIVVVVIVIVVAWPVEVSGATPKIKVILLNEVPNPRLFLALYAPTIHISKTSRYQFGETKTRRLIFKCLHGSPVRSPVKSLFRPHHAHPAPTPIAFRRVYEYYAAPWRFAEFGFRRIKFW